MYQSIAKKKSNFCNTHINLNLILKVKEEQKKEAWFFMLVVPTTSWLGIIGNQAKILHKLFLFNIRVTNSPKWFSEGLWMPKRCQ